MIFEQLSEPPFFSHVLRHLHLQIQGLSVEIRAKTEGPVVDVLHAQDSGGDRTLGGRGRRARRDSEKQATSRDICTL